MDLINYYRFGAYALFATGLINLQYQTGSENNLGESSILIGVGALILIATFQQTIRAFLLKASIRIISLICLFLLIIYSILI